MMRRIGSTWLVRVGIATAALAGAGMMADPAHKVASGAAAGASDATLLHAAALFAIVWLIAGIRIRPGHWRLGFDPLPVRFPGGQRSPAASEQASTGGDSTASGKF
ncbi:hypothetical protein ACG873_21195 [Mesorhizobium sp. AaZ16]|uniref:hypothetical protein n=1 Tax=Mesorhizobium sp. AaZ16 TaxID=3402289 RepID=UPI00374E61B4